MRATAFFQMVLSLVFVMIQATASADPGLSGSQNDALGEVFRSRMQIAQDSSCRPPEAVPNGSYKQSCVGCKVGNCDWLICRCDGKDTSIQISKCVDGTICNNRGSLRCDGTC